FLKSAVIVDCKRIEDAYIYKYIVSEVKNNGRNISDLAVRALIEMTNGNMSSICCEISKLCAIYSKDETINHLNVLEVVQKSVEYSIYELSDALSKRDGNAAISLIKNMLLSKEEPSMLLSLISSHFRRLLFVSISDISNEELAMLLGVKEYAIKKAKENAKLFSVRKLKGVNELLENVDYMQKSGEMSSENCLFYVVFNIIHEKDN
ncbi:MAG: DNA polymerase III subunit delta, partial [Clostridia bacterium]